MGAMVSNRTYGHDEIRELGGENEYHGCRMSGLDLRGVVFTGSKFVNCNFVNSSLIDAKLNDCDLSGCDLSHVNLGGANLFSTAFRECKLLGVAMMTANITAAVFEKCIFDYSHWRGMDLTGMDFAHSSFREADLSGTNLTRVNLTNCDLRGCNIEYAKFGQTDLRGSQLDGVSLKDNLHGIIISSNQFAGLAANSGITVLER